MDEQHGTPVGEQILGGQIGEFNGPHVPSGVLGSR
jgi:hypothetical protein